MLLNKAVSADNEQKAGKCFFTNVSSCFQGRHDFGRSSHPPGYQHFVTWSLHIDIPDCGVQTQWDGNQERRRCAMRSLSHFRRKPS